MCQHRSAAGCSALIAELACSRGPEWEGDASTAAKSLCPGHQFMSRHWSIPRSLPCTHTLYDGAHSPFPPVILRTLESRLSGLEKGYRPLKCNAFPTTFQADDEGSIPSPAPIN
jgi:hypothetical protein